jgi:hypothetical protein
MVMHWVLYKQLHLYAKCRLPRIWSQLQATEVVDIQLNIYQQDGIRWHWSMFEKPSWEPSWIIELGVTDQYRAPYVCQYHLAGFLFLKYVKVCYLCAWSLYRYETSFMVWLSQLPQVCWTEHGKNLRTDLILFVPPMGHISKCTKLIIVMHINYFKFLLLTPQIVFIQCVWWNDGYLNASMNM